MPIERDGTVPLRLIGYWRNDRHPEYPDPHDMVDEAWHEDDRDAVSTYFSSGTYLRGFMGLSPCRFCGEDNGSSEFTDGVLARRPPAAGRARCPTNGPSPAWT
ncbi:hypothetical protein [Cellulomonas xiejunii]|uniref:Uncharacterized protein n=1 Tax=Cellulomonas xiejunii TaxID=2968083 RepID=A0ABY5KR66_9CELL|nr:hypothetical protein [Cellulomonas xiejunii]UUI72285.1 hypothetical protein NP048_02110 [Cellulomonas xiejunii]